MFSTALGAARLSQANSPERVLNIIQRYADDAGLSMEGIVLSHCPVLSAEGDHYRIRCYACGKNEGRVVREGSVYFSLDSLLARVVQFIDNHQHGPQPVPEITGSVTPALVVYPKGYRKFREV